jgi:hypothetical protein
VVTTILKIDLSKFGAGLSSAEMDALEDISLLSSLSAAEKDNIKAFAADIKRSYENTPEYRGVTVSCIYLSCDISKMSLLDLTPCTARRLRDSENRRIEGGEGGGKKEEVDPIFLFAFPQETDGQRPRRLTTAEFVIVGTGTFAGNDAQVTVTTTIGGCTAKACRDTVLATTTIGTDGESSATNSSTEVVQAADPEARGTPDVQGGALAASLFVLAGHMDLI